MLTETRRQIRSVLVWLPVVATLTPAMPVRAERLPIRAYTTADGLAHETVNRIVPDSRGFLWFCTADGLSRFDGYAFTNFRSEEGLPPGAANDLLETRAGEYWVATDGGLVLFNPKGRPQRGVVYESEAPAERPMFTVVVPGDPRNLKITRPADLSVAAALLDA